MKRKIYLAFKTFKKRGIWEKKSNIKKKIKQMKYKGIISIIWLFID